MWLTVRELSDYIKLKEKTIYHLVSNGMIPHYRIGKLVRFNQKKMRLIVGWNQKKQSTVKRAC